MKLKVLVRAEAVGGYSVSVPGCHSEGETLEEALANVREAAELWLEVSEASRKASAEAQTPETAFHFIEF